MSVLEDLTHSEQFVNCAFVIRKLMETLGEFEGDMKPGFMGNYGKSSIILAPLTTLKI
jgi:hypothetical protein